MQIDNKKQSNDIHCTNEKEAIFALQMYMNRFMWISTKEIVAGTPCFYSDTKPKKDADLQ